MRKAALVFDPSINVFFLIGANPCAMYAVVATSQLKSHREKMKTPEKLVSIVPKPFAYL